MVAQAPVPLEDEPRHRVRFDNSLVRLLEVFIPPADATLLHTHAHDIVCVTLTNASIWTESELGERRESTETAGQVSSNTRYSKAPRAHRLGNRGKTPFHFIAVEILAPSGSTAGPLITGYTAKSYTSVLEDENVIAYRLRLAPGDATGRHRYRRPAVLVRLPDGGFEWIEEGTERELNNPRDSRSEAVAIAIALK